MDQEYLVLFIYLFMFLLSGDLLSYFDYLKVHLL